MSSEKEGPPMLSLADFDVCPLDAPIAALDNIDMTSLSLAYHQVSATTPVAMQGSLSPPRRNRGNSSHSRRTWQDLGPGTSFGDRRSMIPSDIRGEQSDVLEAVLPRFKHPALRARLADIVWTNDLAKAEWPRQPSMRIATVWKG